MSTLVVYPKSNRELYHDNNGTATYAVVQGAANATSSVVEDDGQNYWIELGQEYADFFGTAWFYLRRAGLVFDTSPLPDDAIISACTLSLYGKADYSDTNFDIVLVSGADLADPPVVADYGDLLNDTVSRGSMNTSAWVTSGYNIISLNATGISEISVSGLTKFGLRSSRDISATTPKLNGADAIEAVDFFAVEDVESKRPKLTITYTATVEGRHVWTEGTGLHYFTQSNAEKTITGTDTLANGTADGQIFVEGTYLHYIDASLDERRTEGTLGAASGKLSGHIWVEGDNLHYIDATGAERYIAGV